MSKTNRKLIKEILESSDAFEVGAFVMLMAFALCVLLLTITYIIMCFIK